MTLLLLIIGSYLLGSVSFSVVIVQLLTGRDLRREGSGNAGATNALRIGGGPAGAITLVLDIAKGAAPVLLARALSLDPRDQVLMGSAAVLGHVYPCFFRFRGGKGVATAAGALGAIAPLPILGAVVVFIVTVKWSGYVSLGSMLSVSSFPLLLWTFGAIDWIERPSFSLVVGSFLVPLLIILKHTTNLKRLLQGSEIKLGAEGWKVEEE